MRAEFELFALRKGVLRNTNSLPRTFRTILIDYHGIIQIKLSIYLFIYFFFSDLLICLVVRG